MAKSETAEAVGPSDEKPQRAARKVKPPIAETQEFKDAVSAAVTQVLPALRAQILGNLNLQRGSEETAQPAPGDRAFADALAMAIAQLNDQGTGRTRVSPEIIKQRATAREKMTALIIQARASGRVPTYGLKNKVYLDEMLVDPVYIAPDHTQQQTVIDWSSVPNEAMVPLNDTAKAIFEQFTISIGTVEKPVPEAPIGGVTAGGLVVRTASKAMRPATALGHQAEAPATEGGLSIKHRGKPGQFVEKAILGTVAEKARQTA